MKQSAINRGALTSVMMSKTQQAVEGIGRAFLR